MTEDEAMVEVFMKAFRGLRKRQRRRLIELLMQEKEFAEDFFDLALVRMAREEKGEDVSLDEYMRRRGVKGESKV